MHAACPLSGAKPTSGRIYEYAPIATPPRRIPVPWTVEDHNDACFIVKDANGVAIAYLYYEEEPGRRTAANLLTKEEARRIRYRRATRTVEKAIARELLRLSDSD